MSGGAYITCQSGGSWNGSLPVCSPVVCPNLGMPAWSSRSSSNFTYGSAVEFKCAVGFNLHGSRTLECQWDGRWNASQPSCLPVECGDLNATANAHVTAINSTYGGVARMLCNDGYRADGDHLLAACQADGLWSRPRGACIGESDNAIRSTSVVPRHDYIEGSITSITVSRY